MVDLQEILNNHVLNHDFGITEGKCAFKIKEFRDEKTGKRITIGHHACKTHGLNVKLIMRKADWEDRVEK